MPIGPKRLPIMEHIGELRQRLIVIVSVLVVLTGALYFFADPILEVLFGPIYPHMPDGAQLTVFGPFESFTFKFKIGLYAAVVLGSPIYLWQILGFFLPALKPKEQRWFIPTVAAMISLFLAGNLFAHQIILAPAFEWIFGQLGANIQLLPSAPDFLTGVTMLLIGFGIAFELPVVIFFLVAFNIVPYATLRKNWRTVWVVLCVVAAMATPDWSPVTMGALWAAMLFLYEGSMLLAKIVLRKRIRAQEARGY